MNLCNKLQSLIQLSKLYQKNPNSIIQEMEIKKKAVAYKKQFTEKASNATSALWNVDVYIYINKSKIKNSLGRDFYYNKLAKTNILLGVLFGIFFWIIIVFDIVILIQFIGVLDFYNYVLVTYKSE